MKMENEAFARRIIAWYAQSGRKNLPWQKDHSIYSVWISEIMLQQTQVNTVIPYFEKFMALFPDIETLAKASVDDILCVWAGLGYYSRARNIHKAATIIEDLGAFPEGLEALMALPGIGKSTAGAILSLALDRPYTILDGNVKRVLCRFLSISGWPGTASVEKHLWQVAEQYTPIQNNQIYSQAMMDLGATVCVRKNPSCAKCPLQEQCQSFKDDTMLQYPYPKAKKNRPLKKIIMAVIMNEKQQVLLLKRADSGIWGGLYSFPECDEETNLDQWLKNKWGCKSYGQTSLAQIKHQFSHFQLHISPLLINIKASSGVADDCNIWVDINRYQEVALPAPITLIFEVLNESR